MKSHDFAHQLESLAKLLLSLPNSEIEEAIQRGFLPDKIIKSEATEKAEKTPPTLPSDIHDQLRKMSPAEIESYLNADTDSFTVSQLLTLTKKLGINASKRQSKGALINVIVRFFEAGQMDILIRSTRKDEN